MLVFSGRANPRFTERLCKSISVPLGKISITDFSDGETFVEYGESLRKRDVFIVQPTCHPANSNLMELLIAINAAKLANPSRIVAVIPYFGYARQDRKTRPRSAISAKLAADLISKAGANHVLTADIHSRAIEGFFDVPFNSICGFSLFIEDIKRRMTKKDIEDLVIVSPDVGGVVRARELAGRLGVPIAILDKRRPRPNASEVVNVIGEVAGKHCVMVDDMVDTAGTICHGAGKLKEEGALSVVAYSTHGVLSGNAVKNIMKSELDEIVLTDTIDISEKAEQCSKIRLVSIAEMFGTVMSKIHHGDSISDLSFF